MGIGQRILLGQHTRGDRTLSHTCELCIKREAAQFLDLQPGIRTKDVGQQRRRVLAPLVRRHRTRRECVEDHKQLNDSTGFPESARQIKGHDPAVRPAANPIGAVRVFTSDCVEVPLRQCRHGALGCLAGDQPWRLQPIHGHIQHLRQYAVTRDRTAGRMDHKKRHTVTLRLARTQPHQGMSA